MPHTSSSQHPHNQYLRWPLALEWQLPATAARKGHEGWLLGTCERNSKKWIGAMSVRLLQLPCLLPSPFNQMKASHGPTFLDMWQNVMHKTSRQTKRYSLNLYHTKCAIWRLIKSSYIITASFPRPIISAPARVASWDWIRRASSQSQTPTNKFNHWPEASSPKIWIKIMFGNKKTTYKTNPSEQRDDFCRRHAWRLRSSCLGGCEWGCFWATWWSQPRSYVKTRLKREYHAELQYCVGSLLFFDPLKRGNLRMKRLRYIVEMVMLVTPAWGSCFKMGTSFKGPTTLNPLRH